MNVGPIQAVESFQFPTNVPVLRVTLHIPDKVVAGRTLQYEVTLTNISSAPIDLTTSPTYEEGLTPDGLVAYQLNGRAAGTIAPGASLTFAMELPVPAGTPSGAQKFIWQMDDSFAGVFTGTVVTVSLP